MLKDHGIVSVLVYSLGYISDRINVAMGRHLKESMVIICTGRVKLKKWPTRGKGGPWRGV